MTEKTIHDSLGRLLSDGLACLDLSPSQQEVSIDLFREFAAALPALRSSVDLRIPDGSVDAHAVTGYHPSGELPWSFSSNASREGLIWSRRGDLQLRRSEATADRGPTGQDPTEPINDGDDLSHFFLCAERMEHMLHEIAESVLERIESHLELSPGWFQSNVLLGNPMESLPISSIESNRVYHHQWHLKNFVFDASPNSSALSPPQIYERVVVLPVHTDPSLVSVVILDRPGKQQGAQGLQYWDRQASRWREVETSGHGVAVVLIGSVLSRITSGHLHAPKHRVIGPVPHEPLDYRRAATLFLRPAPDALLQIPPSPVLMERGSSSANPPRKEKVDPITFDEWTSRVSKNYRRRKAHVK
jgi:isopenicillin N synthase-like dioxygenase